MASRFEHDMDDEGAVNIAEKSETAIENEDESDQAKASGSLLTFLHRSLFHSLITLTFFLQHYLESNEKYYMMAHR